MKKILMNSGTKAIKLPSEVWKKAGWKLKDEVELTICENDTCKGKNEKWNSISIDRVEDLVKYEEDYPYKEEQDE